MERMNPNERGKRDRIERYPIPSDRLWVDPGLITRICRFSYQNVTVMADTITLIAPNNPKRIALGVTTDNGLITLYMSPWPDFTNVRLWFDSVTTGTRWYTLRDHLSLVTSDWYGYADTNCAIRVTQIERE